MPTTKLLSQDETGEVSPHDYGDYFFLQPFGDAQRLVIGPSLAHLQLMSRLATRCLAPPYRLVYVLLTEQAGYQPGRYQSPNINTVDELREFLMGCLTFLESDARHHFWIGSADGTAVLVYDQHNVLFAYGPLQCLMTELFMADFRPGEFIFPSPHAHTISPKFDPDMERLLSQYEWEYAPLEEEDLWD